MKKNEVVKNKIYFNNIIKNAKYFKNEYFVIYNIRKEKPTPNFGIAVGTKIGNAVTRNKIKRRIRNIIDENKFLFPKYNDYIIMVRKKVLDLNFEDLNNNFHKLIIEKGEKNEK